MLEPFDLNKMLKGLLVEAENLSLIVQLNSLLDDVKAEIRGEKSISEKERYVLSLLIYFMLEDYFDIKDFPAEVRNRKAKMKATLDRAQLDPKAKWVISVVSTFASSFKQPIDEIMGGSKKLSQIIFLSLIKCFVGKSSAVSKTHKSICEMIINNTQASLVSVSFEASPQD
ncbi:MAG TPA: hypothetical protein PK950_01340 [Candidatus Paceibacterota bacterium]|nr:hypothetical protein [Candidatus Paceibacterota bacterium]